MTQGYPVGSHLQAPKVRGRFFFLGAFIFACFLFWWLPSILYRAVVHQADAVDGGTIAISIAALALFVAGYIFPASGTAPRPSSRQMLDVCGRFAYRATILIFIPALVLGIDLLHNHAAMAYGAADAIPRPFQVVLYTHLFFGFMYLGASDPETEGWQRVVTVIGLITLPRLLESLHGGRFFLAQAIVPAVLIAVARGWIRFSMKRVGQIAALVLMIIFVPSLTRGDSVFGVEGQTISFFAAGSSLRLYQDNRDLSLSGRCPPLLVSFTAKTIPYGLLGVCVVDFAGLKQMPATLERILTINDPTTFNGTASGTGANYLLDLDLFGGMAAVFVGSALFGFSCRRFVGWIGKRSLFSGIWAESLTRALMAPRGTLGYVYERIPSLVVATILVMTVAWATWMMEKELVGRSSAQQGSRPPGRVL